MKHEASGREGRVHKHGEGVGETQPLIQYIVHCKDVYDFYEKGAVF